VGGVLRRAGIDAVHWSQVGAVDATDAAIMTWAREHGRSVFTHDLDFGALLAATGEHGPSVVLVRTLDVMPGALGPLVVRTLTEHAAALDRGAIITVDGATARLRILPIRRG
jgi:predicted nuclease of predicted toxin-antitoxin system